MRPGSQTRCTVATAHRSPWRLPLTWSTQQRLFAGVLLLPALALVTIVLGIPILAGIVTSLQRIRLNAPQRNSWFVGVDNYERVLTSGDFWHSFWVSIQYTVGAVGLTFALGFGAALLVSRSSWFNSGARVLLMLPWATPLVAGALTWGIMFDTDSGIVNQFMRWLPGNHQSVPWLVESETALYVVIVVDAWHTFPVAMVLLLAGLQAIPRELYEAASIDGATAWQKFRFVTLPILAPISGLTLLLLAVWAFRRFDVVYLLTRGGPGDATRTLIMETFDRAFRYYDLSTSATLGVITLLISSLMAAVYLRSIRRQVQQ
jgi:ABC-type sugar transport system permease subunit